MSNLVHDLQRRCIDPEQKLVDLLRFARLVAKKLGVEGAAIWMEHELNGYPNNAETPPYRKIRGHLKAMNPYHGWIPVMLGRSDMHWLEERSVTNPVGVLEDMAIGKNDAVMAVPPEIQERIWKASDGPRLEISLHIDRGQVLAIVQCVRNKLLDWSLELDALGIRGNDMEFTSFEKQQAQTHPTILINNSGNISGVTGSVHGDMKANLTIKQADIAQLKDLLIEVKSALDKTVSDETLKHSAHQVIEEIESEGSNSSPNLQRIKYLFAPIVGILERVSSDVVAAAILGKLRLAGWIP